jgi:hypothetical protein
VFQTSQFFDCDFPMKNLGPQNSTPGSPSSRARDEDYLLGRLKQLQTRRPHVIRGITRSQLVLDVEFYREDTAIDATHQLLDHGITAVHRMNAPRVLSLQLPSLLDQRQGAAVVELLDAFLESREKPARKPDGAPYNSSGSSEARSRRA